MPKDLKIFKYKSDAIEVHYDLKRCIHAAECVRGLPKVFDINRKPWINPELGTADEIAEVIRRCPSGALKFVNSDNTKQEELDYSGRVNVTLNGPLYINGDITVVDKNGNELSHEGRIALCRCGASKNKPYCDNSHKEINFHD